MWEVKEQHVIKEERPYNHANFMDYLRWYRQSTHIRLCSPRISKGHQDGASRRNAIADTKILCMLRYTPRAHLIHSVTDKLTILAKDELLKGAAPQANVMLSLSESLEHA